MRVPTCPSKSPARDNVNYTSVFGVSAMLGFTHRRAVVQKTTTEVAQTHEFDDPSLLVENMTAAFAQRCDHLMDDMAAAQTAPVVFAPEWPITVMMAGTRNEEWMFYWSHMRRSRR